MEILLATGNAAKQAKLRWLIDGLGFTTRTPRERGVSLDPAERESSHREVAAEKAVAWSRHAGMLVIASDGGAHIPALGASWNSLFTRRAAGTDADDRDRADHLLALMAGRSGPERDVTWIEAVAVAQCGTLLGAWEEAGAIGRLVEQYDPAKVAGGFWFPALLLVPRFGRLYADLTPAELAQVDDGWNALRGSVRPFLAGLVGKGPEPEAAGAAPVRASD